MRAVTRFPFSGPFAAKDLAMDAGESNANTEPQTGDGRRGSVPSVASATPAGTAATTEPAAQGLPSAAAAESPGQPSQAEAAQPADGAPRTVPVVTLLLTPSPPHPNTPPPFAFEPLERDLFENVVLKIGRQVNRGVNPRDSLAAGRDCVWFKSKVVSRNHAEIWVKDGTVG